MLPCMSQGLLEQQWLYTEGVTLYKESLNNNNNNILRYGQLNLA